MAYVNEKIPLFAPIDNDDWLFKISSNYLCLSNQMGAQVIDPKEFDQESILCDKKFFETSCIECALKVASMVLSLGILPLLAMIVLVIHRCGIDYKWKMIQIEHTKICNNSNLPYEVTISSEEFGEVTKELEPGARQKLEDYFPQAAEEKLNTRKYDISINHAGRNERATNIGDGSYVALLGPIPHFIVYVGYDNVEASRAEYRALGYQPEYPNPAQLSFVRARVDQLGFGNTDYREKDLWTAFNVFMCYEADLLERMNAVQIWEALKTLRGDPADLSMPIEEYLKYKVKREIHSANF